MDKKKVLFISQEISPYLADTPMSLKGRQLPQGIQEQGFEVRTFMPKYGCINERRNQLHEVIRLSGMNIIIDDSDHPLIIKVATLQPARMQVYFIDNDDYFTHQATKELEINLSPEDNDERIMFFVRGVMETVKKLRWEPAVVHCSGWITALAPIYLKRMYNEDPSFRSSKVVYSIYADPFEGQLDARFADKLRMDRFAAKDIKVLGKEPVDAVTLQKLAIENADGVIVEDPLSDATLIDYARSLGKPLLEYIEGEEDAARYARIADFYNGL